MSNTQASGIDFVKRYTELRKEFNIVDALRKLQIESSSPPQEPSAKADEMERLKNKLADDFRKNYTLDLNAEGAAEEGFKAGWDKLLVLLQNHPSAKAIAEAANQLPGVEECMLYAKDIQRNRGIANDELESLINFAQGR